MVLPPSLYEFILSLNGVSFVFYSCKLFLGFNMSTFGRYLVLLYAVVLAVACFCCYFIEFIMSSFFVILVSSCSILPKICPSDALVLFGVYLLTVG